MIVVFLTIVLLSSKVNGNYFTQHLTSKHLKFLQDKGYLDPPDPYAGAIKTREGLTESLRRFQDFSGIPITGELDDATIQMFNKPRCGMADIRTKNGREKRYVLQGQKWDKKILTYRILNYSPDLSRYDIDLTIKQALLQWQKVSQLHFIEIKKGKADIMIKFSRKNHGDPYPFDGPGNTLAHAFYPGVHELAGDTHFDEDEVFTLKSKHGKNFYWIALHEFGHAIGLEHSNLRGTIMYPWYEKYISEDAIRLSDDDKKGIQALYGKPRGEVDPKYVKKKLCISRVKIIFSNGNSETVVINDDKVYEFDVNLYMKSGPTHISKYFPGLNKVDLAFQKGDGRIIFLYGSRYWEFSGRNLIHGPVPVSEIGFTADMHNLNAGFRWGRNRKIYLFKGLHYWRYDDTRQSVDTGYPKLISAGWRGVPANFDTVFQWKNNKVYFFKGSNYYRFNDRTFEVYKGYPMNIRREFFMCKRSPTFSKFTDRERNSSISNHVISNFSILLFSFISFIL